MGRTATVIAMAVRILGTLQLILGLLFWTGNALGLVGIHILNGLLIVILLWVLAGLGVASRAVGLAAFALVWGAFTVWLGLFQTELLHGGLHWLIQVAHLLVGLIAIGTAERLGQTIRDRREVRTAA